MGWWRDFHQRHGSILAELTWVLHTVPEAGWRWGDVSKALALPQVWGPKFRSLEPTDVKWVWLSIIPAWEGRDRQGDSQVSWVQWLAWPYYISKLWLWPTDLASLKLIPNMNRSPPACAGACIHPHTCKHTYTHEMKKAVLGMGKDLAMLTQLILGRQALPLGSVSTYTWHGLSQISSPSTQK